MRFSVFTLLICIGSISFGSEYNGTNELDSLLDSYYVSSEQSLKTRKESLGHLISYTAKDLKIMQVNKLSDITKLLPLASMQSNLYGVLNLTYAGTQTGVNTSTRLYIDNHEVSSLQTLSPWLIYDNYPLDHISHIEIYIGEGSLTLGNEPSYLTIKLYTKNPKILNGGTLRANTSSNNSYDTALTYAQENDESSFLTMLNNSTTHYDKIYYNGNNLSKDAQRVYGYVNFETIDYKLNMGYANIAKDPFVWLSKNASPDDGKMKSQDYFMSISKSFDDNSGKFFISVDKNNRQYSAVDRDGNLILPIIPKKYNDNLTFTKYDLSVSKEFNFKSNNLLLASSFKHKDYKINSRDLVYLDNTTASNVKFSDIKYESILSFMLEDNYYFNDNTMFVFDIKYDKYYKNDNFSDFDRTSNRVGLISMLSQNFGIKAFATKSFTPPSMYEIDFANAVNKDIKPEDKKTYSIEAVYENELHKLSVLSKYSTTNNAIGIGNSVGLNYINQTSQISDNGFYIIYKRKINTTNELNFNIYKAHNNIGTYFSPVQGATFSAMQSIDNFSFYEELIFKDGYMYGGTTHIDDSYNLSLSGSYYVSKDLTFGIKCENILDNDMDIAYKDYTNISSPTIKTIPNSNRRALLTVKWTF